MAYLPSPYPLEKCFPMGVPENIKYNLGIARYSLKSKPEHHKFQIMHKSLSDRSS